MLLLVHLVLPAFIGPSGSAELDQKEERPRHRKWNGSISAIASSMIRELITRNGKQGPRVRGPAAVIGWYES